MSVINKFPKAIENHLFVLKQVILHFYGFVVNHLELSAELSKHNLSEDDFKTIDGFRTFMYFFIPLFVDRFFELNKSLDTNFIEGILKIIDFMFPESGDHLNDKSLIQNQHKKNKRTKIGIQNFLMKALCLDSKIKTSFPLTEHILKLSENALDALLKLTGIKNKENWKKKGPLLKVVY